MTAILYVLQSLTHLLLSILTLLMTVRAVMSWLPFGEDDNAFIRFLYGTTEPFIYPVRMLLNHFPAMAEFPLDLSFMITYFLLVLLRTFL